MREGGFMEGTFWVGLDWRSTVPFTFDGLFFKLILLMVVTEGEKEKKRKENTIK